MIVQVNGITTGRHVGNMAAHLLRTDENEHVGAVEFRGTAERARLSDALGAMFRTRELMKSDMGLYHISYAPPAEVAADMTPEQWRDALATVEKRFNLTDQPRVMIPHVKGGRLHVHCVYQVCDTERGRRCHDFSHDRKAAADLGAEIAVRHQLQEVERKRTGGSYDRAAQQIAKREGTTPAERKKAVRDAWENSSTGAEFRERLHAVGLDVARGDKGIVLVTPTGTPAALGPELRGTAKVADVEKRFPGESLEPLAVVKKRQREWLRTAKERAQAQQNQPSTPPSSPPPDRATRERRPIGRDLDAFQAAAMATMERRKIPKEPDRVTPDRTGRSIEEAAEAARAVLQRRAQEQAAERFREAAPAATGRPEGISRTAEMTRSAREMGFPRLSAEEVERLRERFSTGQPKRERDQGREID